MIKAIIFFKSARPGKIVLIKIFILAIFLIPLLSFSSYGVDTYFLFSNEKGDLYGKIEGMVYVKGGCFEMGDAVGDGISNVKPAHTACVDDFYIGETEVTQAQWEAMMEYDPSEFKGKDLPVERVSWNDVQEFIKRLKQKTSLEYRLPTEAEWEYAARSGGKKEKWAGTNREYELSDYAWYGMNSNIQTYPVRQKRPNGFGLYDMSGNVSEWVEDWYSLEYYKVSPKENPEGPSTGEYRVLRGGSWVDIAGYICTTYRDREEPDKRSISSGFRLALSYHRLLTKS